MWENQFIWAHMASMRASPSLHRLMNLRWYEILSIINAGSSNVPVYQQLHLQSPARHPHWTPLPSWTQPLRDAVLRQGAAVHQNYPRPLLLNILLNCVILNVHQWTKTAVLYIYCVYFLLCTVFPFFKIFSADIAFTLMCAFYFLLLCSLYAPLCQNHKMWKLSNKSGSDSEKSTNICM